MLVNPQIKALAQKAWDEYTKQSTINAVIKGVCPILYFGDYPAYLESEVKIVTVGLNPSGAEFSIDKGKTHSVVHRFTGASDCPPDYAAYLNSLNEYFEYNPYTSWFSAFEHILKGMGASYYRENGSCRVLHTDICSPLATEPTWSGVSSIEKSTLQKSGIKLWCELMIALKPDIILISVATEYVKSLRLTKGLKAENISPATGPKQTVISDIIAFQCKDSTEIIHTSSILIGRTVNKPFGAIGNEDKISLGKKIMDEYRRYKQKS